MKRHLLHPFNLPGRLHWISICVFSILLLQGTIVMAQNGTIGKHRYFGLGINLNNLNSGILRLNFDPGDYMRVEFQYGRSSSQNETWYFDQNGVNTKAILHSKTIEFAISALGCLPFQNAKFFAGFSYFSFNSSNDYLYYDPNWNFYQGVYTSKSAADYFGPTLGAEYRFGNRFSIGADISFLKGNQLNSPGSPNSIQTESSRQITQTSLFFRFFPF